MKRICLVLLLLVTALSSALQPAHSNDVLVLIQPALAGPDVPAQNYWKPEWILWPPTFETAPGGRLLSMASGVNWMGGGSVFQPSGVAELERRGYFEARRKMLGGLRVALLVNKTGAASSNALLLALEEGATAVRPYRIDRSWPANELMVTEASNWDEVRAFEGSTTGRVLVVEYPPRADVPWTRYWLYGHHWQPSAAANSSPTALAESVWVPTQKNQAVPGLIRASQIMRLASEPETFHWDRVDFRTWPGANRFLEMCHVEGPWVAFVWMIFAAVLSIWGSILVKEERTSRLLPVLLSVLILSPASIDLAGFIGKYLGLAAWPIWLLLASISTLAIATLLGMWHKRKLPRAHPLAGIFLTGLVLLCLINPIWSFMSPLFGGRSWPVSPVGIAALFGYLTGFVASLRGCGMACQWVGRLSCVVFLVGGTALRAWWTADLNADLLIPIFAWLIGEGRFRWPMLVFVLLWPGSVVQMLTYGMVWSPAGLLFFGRDVSGINLYDHFEFLISPGLLFFLPVAGGIALFGFRFFFHQIRALARLDARRNALPLAAIVAIVFGVLHPMFLYASLTLSVGAISAILFDAVQTM